MKRAAKQEVVTEDWVCRDSETGIDRKLIVMFGEEELWVACALNGAGYFANVPKVKAVKLAHDILNHFRERQVNEIIDGRRDG